MYTKKIRVSKPYYDAMSFEELWDVRATLAVNENQVSRWTGRPYISVVATFRSVPLFKFQCDSLEEAQRISNLRINELASHTKLIDNFLQTESVENMPSFAEHLSSDKEFERLVKITGRPIGDLIREYMKSIQEDGLSEYDLTDEQKKIIEGKIGKREWLEAPISPTFDIARVLNKDGTVMIESARVLLFDNDCVSFDLAPNTIKDVPFLFEITHINSAQKQIQSNVLYEAYQMHFEHRFLEVHFWKYRKVDVAVF